MKGASRLWGNHMERYGSYLGHYPWQILKNLSSPTVIFIDLHFPVPEASANTRYCRAMPFLSLYKSDCLSSGLQGDIGWFLWRCLRTSEEISSRLRGKMKQRTPRRPKARATEVTGPLCTGLPVGASPHDSTSFGFPSDTSEIAGLRCGQHQYQTLSQIHNCSSYTSVPFLF